MTCIVLTKNPSSGGILALTEGDENDLIAQWRDASAAATAAQNHRLIQAWGGWIVDLDELEVREL